MSFRLRKVALVCALLGSYATAEADDSRKQSRSRSNERHITFGGRPRSVERVRLSNGMRGLRIDRSATVIGRSSLLITRKVGLGTIESMGGIVKAMQPAGRLFKVRVMPLRGGLLERLGPIVERVNRRHPLRRESISRRRAKQKAGIATESFVVGSLGQGKPGRINGIVGKIIVLGGMESLAHDFAKSGWRSGASFDNWIRQPAR